MQNTKVVTAGLVVFTSLIVGYFVVSAKTPSFLPSVDSMRREQPSSAGRLSESALGGKLPYGGSRPIARVENVKNLPDRISSMNVTARVVDSIFSDPSLRARLRNINPNDPSSVAMLEGVLGAGIKNAQSDFKNIFSVNITDDEIKTSTDNSDGAKREYLRAIAGAGLKIQALSAKFLAEIRSSSPESLCDPSGALPPFARDIKNALASTAGISVPSDWKDTQRLILKYATQSSLIYEGFLGCGTDPVKAILAGNAIADLAETGNTVRLVLNQKAKEVGYEGTFY